MNWRSSSFFATADKVGTFLLANFAWVVLALTIVGLPFGTLGLFAVMTAWVQGRQPEFFRAFGDAVREHWRKALVIAAVDLAVGGLLAVNLTIFPLMNMGDVFAALSRGVTIAVGLILLMANVYIWPLVMILDFPLGELTRLTFRLIFTYPLQSAALLLATLLPLAVSLLLPIVFLLFVTISVMAYIASYGTWRMVQRQRS